MSIQDVVEAAQRLIAARELLELAEHLFEVEVQLLRDALAGAEDPTDRGPRARTAVLVSLEAFRSQMEAQRRQEDPYG